MFKNPNTSHIHANERRKKKEQTTTLSQFIIFATFTIFHIAYSNCQTYPILHKSALFSKRVLGMAKDWKTNRLR